MSLWVLRFVVDGDGSVVVEDGSVKSVVFEDELVTNLNCCLRLRQHHDLY